MNNDRRHLALNIRVSAAELAANRPHPRHVANGDEQRFRHANGEPSYLASFTKGMPHDYDSGLVKYPSDFRKFIKGIDSGDPRDFIDTHLGPDNGMPVSCEEDWKSKKAQNAKIKVRAWESQGAGRTFDLEGPDAQAVTMPPAPALGSDELTAEIAEVYAQALLRDVPFTQIVDLSGKAQFKCKDKGEPDTTCENEEQSDTTCKDVTVKDVVDYLNKLTWFKDNSCCALTAAELARKRRQGGLTGQTVFRGITPGDDIGPYISQFLLAGNTGINGNDKEHEPKDGLIAYGALNIDQRVRIAQPYEDHMTTWDEWFDVQEGADLRGMENYVAKCGGSKVTRRFITTPRDMATYVHYDALYEAYLNACLILMGLGIPFDPDIPFQDPDCKDHQQGFAHFGGPHILSLVTEVATRALKAVRFQKFNVHRRLRPEALAARLTRSNKLGAPELNTMINTQGLQEILSLIAKKNGSDDPVLRETNYLLPMAFCEGSPMHPSYGAGHATVAGACVTILKAFFDHKHPLTIAGSDDKAFVPTENGCELKSVDVIGGKLTVEGELNKLASNIAIGRDWAGVHYFSDYIESLRMGEQIAIGILEEQKLTYGENFSMTVPLFDGGSIRI